MEQTLRPYLTAGVALVGASMIAVTPVAAPPSLDIQQQLRDVALTASGFELPPFGDILTDAKTSVTDLGIAFKDLGGAFGDPSEAIKNLTTALAAVTFLHGDQKSFLIGGEDIPTGAAALSNDAFHSLLFGILTAPTNPLSPDDPPILPENVVPIIDVLASPLSGVLIGDVSPVIAPVVPFLNPFLELIGDLASKTTPDFGQIGTELLEAPFNSIFGLFAGSTLNLDLLVPLIEKAGILPAEFSISGLSMDFGGLFSPGETLSGPGSDLDNSVLGAGGSIINGLGIDTLLNIPGQGVGPIGAMAGLVYAVGQALGGKLPPLEPPTPPSGTEAVDPGLFSNFFDSVGLDQLGSDFANIGL